MIRLLLLPPALLLVALTHYVTASPPATTARCVEVARVPATDSSFPPTVLSISPQAAQVAVRIRTGTFSDLKDELKLYDTIEKQWVEPPIKAPAGEQLESILFSPDGQWQLAFFLGPRMHRALRIYHAPEMREVAAVQTEGYLLAPTAFSADNKLLVRPDPRQGSKPFSFAVVDLETGEVRSTLNIELRLLSHGMFHRIAFTPDGKWVYSNQNDRVLIWEVATGELVTYWSWTGTGAVAALGATPDGRLIRVLMQEGSIVSFDTSSNPHSTTEGRLDVPEVDQREPRRSPFQNEWSFNETGFSPDASHVLNSKGGNIREYNVDSGKLVRLLTLPEDAAAVDFSARQGDLVPAIMKDHSVAIVRIPP
jgi:hypothetical protein